MFVQRYFRVDRHFIVRKTWPPSFHPGRHVNMLFCLHDFREGTVNRETGCLTPTRFFFNVWLHSYSYLGSRYLKYFSQKVLFSFHAVLWNYEAPHSKSLSSSAEALSLPSPQPSTVKPINTSVATEKRSSKLTVRKCRRIWQQVRSGEAILIKATKYSYQFSLIQWTVRSLDLAIMQLMQSV